MEYQRYLRVMAEEAMYTSKKHGNDETGDGSETNPFKTPFEAVLRKTGVQWPKIFVDGQEEISKYQIIPEDQFLATLDLFIEVYMTKKAELEFHEAKALELEKELIILKGRSTELRNIINHLGMETEMHIMFASMILNRK